MTDFVTDFDLIFSHISLHLKSQQKKHLFTKDRFSYNVQIQDEVVVHIFSLIIFNNATFMSCLNYCNYTMTSQRCLTGFVSLELIRFYGNAHKGKMCGFGVRDSELFNRCN